MQRLPSVAPSSALPSASTMTGLTLGSGRVAEPGFSFVAPGNVEMRMPPVSVCHHVSNIGQRLSPTTRYYHSQASGLMGSPTDTSSRRLLRLDFFTASSAPPMSERMAVGAV